MATELPKSARDDMASTVIQRYRRAKNRRENYILHQGHCVQYLMERSRAQYDREYTTEDANQMANAFGFTPTRYYGVVQQKVNATFNWKLDLVVTNLDSMFTVNPTPEPDIDDASRRRIREAVRMQLMARMAEIGLADPELLLDSRGRVNPQVEGYLIEQAQALKTVEQARIVSSASQAAQKAQLRLRDRIVEGGFRQAYFNYSFDQILFGRGVMRVPHWQTRPVRYHTPSGGISRRWEVVPMFSHVDVFEFFPIDDGVDLQTNTGNTQRTTITKAELINMARRKDSGYYRDVIEDILEDFSYQNRNWLEPDDSSSQEAPWWGLDDTIPMLIHEGFFSGDELSDMGISGVASLDYLNARVEVVGGYTIRCELIESDGNPGRTYHQSPFVKTGKGIYDAIGMGAMLWDTEQRINRLLHIFEHNIDWSSRPPVMRNKSAFDNPHDAAIIVPGEQYDVDESFGVAGSMPDALRTMNTVSAQYHLIMTQVGQLIRQADEDCGIPAFAYSSQDFGRSSLGEYSQRMSNALRTIKGLALQEDLHLIEPAFTTLFDYETEEDPNLRYGQDINVVIRGMTGLLKEDLQQKRQQEILPFILQAPPELMPSQAQEYAVRQLLDSAGFPIDALGMRDPIVDNALAQAAAAPVTGMPPAGQQVPGIDGRSGPINPEAVATPGGMSQFNLTQTGPVR